jgi:hypothetical protein
VSTPHEIIARYQTVRARLRGLPAPAPKPPRYRDYTGSWRRAAGLPDPLPRPPKPPLNPPPWGPYSLIVAPHVTFCKCMQAVCDEFQTTPFQIRSRRRTHQIMRPRQILMYVLSELTLMSYPEIARRLGGFDHTTVLSAHRRIANLIETNPEIAARVAAILNAVRVP